MLQKFKDILTCVFFISLLKSDENSEWRFCLPKPPVMLHIYPQGPVNGTDRERWVMMYMMRFLQRWLERMLLSTEVAMPPWLPIALKGPCLYALFLASDICKPILLASLLPSSYMEPSLANLALSHIFLLRFFSHQIFSPHLIWPASTLQEVSVLRSLFKELTIVLSIQLIV